jgi:hypothetical protein
MPDYTLASERYCPGIKKVMVFHTAEWRYIPGLADAPHDVRVSWLVHIMPLFVYVVPLSNGGEVVGNTCRHIFGSVQCDTLRDVRRVYKDVRKVYKKVIFARATRLKLFAGVFCFSNCL